MSAESKADDFERVIMVTGGAGFMYVHGHTHWWAAAGLSRWVGGGAL